MPNIPSITIDKHTNQIKTVRDVFNGVDEVKSRLWHFPKEKADKYTERQNYSTLDNFVKQTNDNIKNIMFRKPIDKTAITNKEFLSYLDNIDFKNNIDTFAKELTVNRVNDGYTWILADMTSFDEKTIQTKAQAKANNLRPYLVNLLRENVTVFYNKFGEIVMAFVREYQTAIDGYKQKQTEVIKVWKDGKIETWVDDEMISIVDNPLGSYIPLTKYGNDDIPPLYDQSKQNIEHYNRNNELSLYVRVGAVPFLALFGNLKGGDDAPKTLGISDGLHFNNKDESDVKWVEMSGDNYKIISERILYHEEQMQRISVEFVSESTIKTATEVEKSSMGNEAKVLSFSQQLEESLNKSLADMGLYRDGGYGDNTITTNKDFDSNILTSQQIAQLTAMRVSGDLSYELYIELLIKGEVIPYLTEKQKETEKVLIKNEGIGLDA